MERSYASQFPEKFLQRIVLVAEHGISPAGGKTM
jgi:hypothetical protein